MIDRRQIIMAPLQWPKMLNYLLEIWEFLADIMSDPGGVDDLNLLLQIRVPASTTSFGICLEKREASLVYHSNAILKAP